MHWNVNPEGNMFSFLCRVPRHQPPKKIKTRSFPASDTPHITLNILISPTYGIHQLSHLSQYSAVSLTALCLLNKGGSYCSAIIHYFHWEIMWWGGLQRLVEAVSASFLSEIVTLLYFISNISFISTLSWEHYVSNMLPNSSLGRGGGVGKDRNSYFRQLL